MSSGYSLRPATAADFDLLYRIKLDSIKPYVERIWGWDESVQKDFLRRETPIGEVSLIVLGDGNIAGFVQIKEKPQEIFIGSLFLTTPFQSKGIGKMILKDLFAHGKTVMLEVLKINTGALRFYQNCGMDIAGETDLKYLMKKDFVK